MSKFWEKVSEDDFEIFVKEFYEWFHTGPGPEGDPASRIRHMYSHILLNTIFTEPDLASHEHNIKCLTLYKTYLEVMIEDLPKLKFKVEQNIKHAVERKEKFLNAPDPDAE